MCAEHLQTARMFQGIINKAWSALCLAASECGAPPLPDSSRLGEAITHVCRAAQAKGTDNARPDPFHLDDLRAENERLRAALRALLGRG